MTPSPAFEVAAHSGGDAKRSYVRTMFTAIAPRYDFLNHLLSLNVDRAWRRAAVRRLARDQKPAGTYLDLGAGPLRLPAPLAPRSGVRISRPRGFGPPAARRWVRGGRVRHPERRDLRHPLWPSITCAS